MMDKDVEIIEVNTNPTEPFWSNPHTYHEISQALNNGAFAVIVMAMICVYFTRNFFRKAVDSYGDLMATLKKSVENNSRAIDRMADSQTRIVDILADFRHSPYGASILKELERQAKELRDINDSHRTP